MSLTIRARVGTELAPPHGPTRDNVIDCVLNFHGMVLCFDTALDGWCDFIQLYCKIASRNTNGISEVTGTGEEAGLGLHLCAVQTQTIPIEHVGLYGACCVLR